MQGQIMYKKLKQEQNPECLIAISGFWPPEGVFGICVFNWEDYQGHRRSQKITNWFTYPIVFFENVIL